MIEYDINSTTGRRYFTVAYVPESDQVQFRHFGPAELTVAFDAKALTQMLEAFKNIQFIRFGKGIKYD